MLNTTAPRPAGSIPVGAPVESSSPRPELLSLEILDHCASAFPTITRAAAPDPAPPVNVMLVAFV